MRRLKKIVKTTSIEKESTEKIRPNLRREGKVNQIQGQFILWDAYA